MTKEKNPLSESKKDFLELNQNVLIYANWCNQKVWNILGSLKWTEFYELLKDKYLQINKVENKWETSYILTEKGISEIKNQNQ